MNLDDFIKVDEEIDERYQIYSIEQIKIFNHVLHADDWEVFGVFISRETTIENVAEILFNYLTWLTDCEKELRGFYERELKEKVSDVWYKTIEVYSACIVFNSEDDYGASVHCGDYLMSDHILEFDIEKRNVVAVRLNG